MQDKKLIPNSTSALFPDYLRLKHVPVNTLGLGQRPGGKKCFADKTSGISEEFPTYFRHENQLVSSYTKPNPYMDEHFIKNSVRDFKINKALSPDYD